MDIKNYFSNEYFKMHKRNFIFLTIVGLWLIYFFWSVGARARTVLMDSIPVWEAHLIIGFIVGSVVTYIKKSLCYFKVELLKAFILGGLSVCILHIYAVCTYLSPGYIIKYESDCNYTPPWVYSRQCNGGLSTKDIHTKKLD